jgi:hypothetical protein
MLRGSAHGTTSQRVFYYLSRTLAGGLVGFFVIAMATSAGGGQHNSLDIHLYYWAAAIGAALGLTIAALPRLLHPRDWPTIDEFRRDSPSSDSPSQQDRDRR